MVGRIVPPQRYPHRNPQNLYVYTGKRDFADVIKKLSWDYPGLSHSGLNIIIRVLKREKGGQSQSEI